MAATEVMNKDFQISETPATGFTLVTHNSRQRVCVCISKTAALVEAQGYPGLVAYGTKPLEE